MKWSIVWSPVTQGDVLRMHWRAAERACAAVIQLAEGRGGSLNAAGPRGVFRLQVPGATALVRLDDATKTVFVLRIYPG